MTDKWQAGHTYAPGALVTRASTPPIEATQATNGYFEDGATGWTFSGSCAYAASGGYSSAGCCIAPGSTAGGLALNNAHFLMAPGERISATCMIQQGASDVDHTRGYVQVLFFDASDAQIGQPVSGNIVNDGRSGAWHASTASGVAAPAGTAYARCGIYLYQNSGDPVWGDNLVVTYARTAPPAGLIYKAVQAAPGKSGTSEPTWPLVNGVQVIDNEVTWEAVTMVRVVWQASPILLSGGTEPAWPTEVGAFVHDGVINWETIDRRVSDPKCPPSKVVAIMASKVFAGDKDIVRFSATVNPLDWSTAQDAGYLPTGLQQANANDMAVLAPYRSNLTAFNASSFQNWQVDPDPAAMALLDQMEGIGSVHQHAAQPVGNELFYLSQLGVRSVSVAAGAESLAAGDVGMPVDPLVQDAVRVSTANGTKVLATYYPSAGQYWLAMRNADPLTITGDLPDGYVGEAADFQYVAAGGVMPLGALTIVSGALPSGLTMDATGHVTGTRTTQQTSAWVVGVTDAVGTQVTLDDASQTRAVAFVASANSGYAYSLNGGAWSRGTGTLSGMYSLGSIAGKIAGYNGSASAGVYSTDGLAWTQATAVSTGANIMAGNNAILVGVGVVGGCVTSADGVVWTKRDIGSTFNYTAVIWFKSNFYAGWFNNLRKSPDGITWAAGAAGVMPSGEDIFCTATDGATLLAGGKNGSLRRSTDGTTWTAVTSPFAVQVQAAAYGSGVWVVMSSAGDIQWSTDLTTWHDVGTPVVGAANRLRYLFGRFVAVYNNGQIAHSLDGKAWTAVANVNPANITSLQDVAAILV